MKDVCLFVHLSKFVYFFVWAYSIKKDTSKEKPRPQVWFFKGFNHLELFRNESVPFKNSIGSYWLETCFSFKSFKNWIYLPTIVDISESKKNGLFSYCMIKFWHYFRWAADDTAALHHGYRRQYRCPERVGQPAQAHFRCRGGMLAHWGGHNTPGGCTLP